MPDQKSEEELWDRVIARKRSQPRLDFTRPDAGFFRELVDVMRVTLERDIHNRSGSEPEKSVEERLDDLEREVQDIKRSIAVSQQMTKSDIIYEKFKEKLEKESYGKIVAIDIQSETIAGIGNTILEAYVQAYRKSGRRKFSFRKVGHPVICKLR